MKILFLSPQPFFQERGTPIAVRLALEVLAKRGRDEIHLLAYHEGIDVPLPGVTIHRISVPRFIKNVGAGISVKKLLCDIAFVFKSLGLVIKHRKAPFAFTHAVEESVFIAWLIKKIWGIPYIYDMDSSLTLQLTDKWVLLRPLKPILEIAERLAIKGSLAVVPVCDTLAETANRMGSPFTQVLRDVSLLSPADNTTAVNLRDEFNIPANSRLGLYIGNLEPYQGVDLLIESLGKLPELSKPGSAPLKVVIIGGSQRHIEEYRKKASELGLSSVVYFAGPRPTAALRNYLQQADLLFSPRTKGNNTPMKVYSYLHSGVPLIATDLPTHTQVLSVREAFLGAPTPTGYGAAIADALADFEGAKKRGQSAMTLAESRYTREVFERELCALYEKLEHSSLNSSVSPATQASVSLRS